jgi:hypothetical protein
VFPVDVFDIPAREDAKASSLAEGEIAACG